MKKKLLAVSLCAAMTLSVLAGCGGSKPAETQAPAATQAAAGTTETKAEAAETEAAPVEGTGKEEMKVLYTVEPSSLFPGDESLSNGHMIQCNLYDTLVLEQEGDRNTLVPGLATDWEYSEDGTTITFTLREGVKFHDGTEMTADDVVFSLTKSFEAPYNADAAALLDKIEKIDDTHVAVSTQFAYKPFLAVMAMPSLGIYSQKWYEEVEASGVNKARVENGCGPYKFVEWAEGDYVTIEAFDEYWGGTPNIKKITFKYIADATTAALSMAANEADFMCGMSMADRPTLETNPSITVQDVPSNGTHFLTYQMGNGAYLGENAYIRKAIQASLNREDIFMGGIDGIGQVSPFCVNPGHFGYNPDWQPTAYDVEAAKQILADGGYDGTTLTYKAANSAWYQNPAQVMTEEMRQIGLNVDLQIMERGAWTDAVDAKGESDIWNYMTWGQFPDADADLWMYVHTSNAGVAYSNVGYAGNADSDAILEKARFSVDDNERKALYTELGDLIEEEGWYSFIMTGSNAVVTSNAIQGFAPHAAQFYRFNHWVIAE